MVFRSCHDLKNTVKKYCFLINKYPGNGSYRKEFYSFRSKYRRKCKIEETKYKQQLCDDINPILKMIQKHFGMQLIKLVICQKKMMKIYKIKMMKIYKIMMTLIRYFESINNHSDKIPNSNFHNSIISHMNQMLEKLMGKQADDTFNEPFQPNEILKAV
jgi:hypothetical protein